MYYPICFLKNVINCYKDNFAFKTEEYIYKFTTHFVQNKIHI